MTEPVFDFPGDHSEEVTPVPIPNTEVKGLSGDGTAAFGRGRVAHRRDLFSETVPERVRSLFLPYCRAGTGPFSRLKPTFLLVL